MSMQCINRLLLFNQLLRLPLRKELGLVQLVAQAIQETSAAIAVRQNLFPQNGSARNVVPQMKANSVATVEPQDQNNLNFCAGSEMMN